MCLKTLNIDDKMFTDRSVQSEISNAKNEMLEPESISNKKQETFKKKKIGQVFMNYTKKG